MFFVLSKTIGIMLLPTNFLIGAALLGAALQATRWARRGRHLLIAAALLFAICGFSPLGDLLLYPLESRFPAWDSTHGAPDGVVVLGGPIDADLSAAHDVPILSIGADRVTTAAILARRYPNARIIYTGGSANLISGDAREADYAGTLLESLGVARAQLTLERRARNTQENAEYAKAIAAPEPGERWLLVTSAYHMPRAVGAFRKAGFSVEPYPVDWRIGGREDLLTLHKFSLDGLISFETAIREWMGLAAYRMSGRTSELFPGPNPP